MTSFEEKAKIIALAKLCGVQGTDEEIYNKFENAYNEVVQSLQEDAKKVDVDKARTFNRPY